MGVKLLIMVSYERNNHSKFPKTFIFSFIWPRKSKIGPKKSKIRKLPPPPTFTVRRVAIAYLIDLSKCTWRSNFTLPTWTVTYVLCSHFVPYSLFLVIFVLTSDWRWGKSFTFMSEKSLFDVNPRFYLCIITYYTVEVSKMKWSKSQK